MTLVSVTRQIEASAEDVWAVLAAYGDVSSFAPHIAASRILDGSPPTGPGALRQCDLSDGRTYIRERVTDWIEGRSYRVEIYEGSMPIRNAFSTASVRPLGPTKSEARIEIGYVPKFGPLGHLLDRVLLRRRLETVACDNLVGLDRFAKRKRPDENPR